MWTEEVEPELLLDTTCILALAELCICYGKYNTFACISTHRIDNLRWVCKKGVSGIMAV